MFATDGLTPLPIFKRSCEETSDLCPQQVLWITRTDTPGWKETLDWFIRQRCARAVCVDTADRWDWHNEHEITLRIAQGLYYREEQKVEAYCWIHDDMAPPASPSFKKWIAEWLKSPSTAVVSNSFQMWDEYDLVRADYNPTNNDPHAWIAKNLPNLGWVDLSKGGRANSDFLPLESTDPWRCPWPFRHYKGVDASFRCGDSGNRRGFQRRWSDVRQKADVNVPVMKYDPELTWDEFWKMVKEKAKP